MSDNERTALPKFDPAHDVLHFERTALQAIFAPQNVAVIGATERPGSVGRTVLWNLISNPFGGTVFPVNPNRSHALGIKAYPDVAAVPDTIDLAVIVTPAPTVPGIVGECVDVGVKGAIIISAGFKEIGEEGAKLERQILEEARRGNMRIIGPNCLGVMNTETGLNATFASRMAQPGHVGFISQSGALCTAILDWSFRENVGFSAFISIGSMVDVGWGDLIYYLGDDPRTKSIVLYMETVGDARSFLSATREVALIKPVIVIKPGRTAGAAEAAASHTGALTGSDEVLEVAFRRSGALRVNTISELFNIAEVLDKQPRPSGPRLTILTNAGGPGVLATDALLMSGGELAGLPEETMEHLNSLLPPHWSRNNPIDILGDADPERYRQAVQIAAENPASDGTLIILTPQAMTEPTQTAEQLRAYAGRTEVEKPLLASWMGGSDIVPGESILNQADIPTFAYPDTGSRMFTYMWRYADNLRSLYETPLLADEAGESNREQAADLLQRARQAGRTILTEFESKQLLAAYDIPVVETRVAESAQEATQIAAEIGYPVVLKLHSETITHKSDVGGVRLNLEGAAEVEEAFGAIRTSLHERVGQEDDQGRPHFLGVTVQPMIQIEGYELIVGSSEDPQFGPIMLFGTGGELVEVLQDRALALPPLNTTLARRMMERTQIYKALKGVRGRPPVDLHALEQALVRFSQLIAEQCCIKEIDINPLLATPDRLIALDARVVVYGSEVDERDLPRLAIRPYPTQYIYRWTMEDGTPVTIRPIRPEDEPLMVDFHQTLSDRSVYMRYLHPMMLSQRVAHERLSRICFNDYDREIALVAERTLPQTGERQILGVARLTKVYGTDQARLALLVSDHFQGLGLGTELLRRALQVGREEHLRRIIADIAGENQVMRHLLEKFGFQIHPLEAEGIVRAEIDLTE